MNKKVYTVRNKKSGYVLYTAKADTKSEALDSVMNYLLEELGDELLGPNASDFEVVGEESSNG